MPTISQAVETSTSQAVTKLLGPPKALETDFAHPVRALQSGLPMARFASALMGMGPQGYWRLGETSIVTIVGSTVTVIDDGGPALDSSGHGHHGTVPQAGAMAGPTHRGVPGLLPGDPDLGVHLGSTVNDCVQVPYGSWMDATSFTLVGLVDPDSVDTHQVFWGRANGTTTLFEVGLSIFGGLYFRMHGQTGVDTDGNTLNPMFTVLSSVPVPSTGTLFYIARWDGATNTATLTLNGVNVGSDVAFRFEPLTGSVGMNFGLLDGTGNSQMEIDEYAFFDRPLTDAESATLWTLFNNGQSISIGQALELDGDLVEIDVFEGPYTYNHNLDVAAWHSGQVTLRQLMRTMGPWAYWKMDQGVRTSARLPDRPAAYLRDLDVLMADGGPRNHPAVARRVIAVPSYGLGGTNTSDDFFGGIPLGAPGRIDRFESDTDAVYDWGSAESYLESLDTISTNDYTVSGWLTVSDPTTVMIPIVTCAPSVGAATFDKCLFLDATGHLAWLVGTGSGSRVIRDPNPFPVGSQPLHVLASIGPAGMKLRVDNAQVAANASKTDSWTGAQKVYIRSGGANASYSFQESPGTGWPSFPRVIAPAIFDRQLTDLESSQIARVGNSYRFYASYLNDTYYGAMFSNEPGHPRMYVTFNPTTYGPASTYHDTLPFNAGLGNVYNELIPHGSIGTGFADPLGDANSMAVELTGGFLTYPLPLVGWMDEFILNMVMQVETLGSTDTAILAVEETVYYAEVISTGVTTVTTDPSWFWQIHNNQIEFKFITGPDLAHLTTTTVQHPASVVAGGFYVVGIEKHGTTVDLWVNGVKASFTMPASQPYLYGVPGYSYDSSTGTVHTAAHTVNIGSSAATATPKALSAKISNFVSVDNNGQNGSFVWYDVPPNYVARLQGAALASGTIIFLAQAIETDISQDMGYNPSLRIVQATEVETSQPVVHDTHAQNISITQATEAETAQSFGPPVFGGGGGVGTSIGALLITSGGAAAVTGDTFVTQPEFQLQILDIELRRAPTAVTVVVSGGEPGGTVTFDIDTLVVYAAVLDTDGNLDPLSISVQPTGSEVDPGAIGDHVLTATEVLGSGATVTSSATYTLDQDPVQFPITAGSDAQAVVVPAAVSGGIRRFVLQDLLPEEFGGIGSYVFPANPATMTSPHYEYALSSQHTTARSGRFHIYQAGNVPKEWTWTGVSSSEEFESAVYAYRDLNRRFYAIDHRNRAWKVVITDAKFVPRLRVNFDGEDTDWVSDYTITLIVLDQDWVDPA